MDHMSLNKILYETANTLNLTNYSFNFNQNVLKGDGFLGEFYKITILNHDDKREIKVALKKAPQNSHRRKTYFIDKLYSNEIWVYSKVFPALQEFERELQISRPFDNIPAYITSSAELGQEIIVLQDITSERFEMIDKAKLLDDEHTSLIFQTYGRFHATTFCLKALRPAKYEELTQSLVNVWACLSDGTTDFSGFLCQMVDKCFDALDDVKDKSAKERYRNYLNIGNLIFGQSVRYNGEYATILHGDCWSNNMMFRYQDTGSNKKLTDIKLLDFQLGLVGTPVYDLSYFFYTGGSKQLFDNLEHYLDLYHQSFMETARTLGCDGEKLFPREVLRKEWRQYAKMGMLMALMLAEVKLVSKEYYEDLINKQDKDEEVTEAPSYNKKVFNERVRDIIVHVNDIGAL